MESNCKICNNSENNLYYSIKEMMLGLNEVFPYFECSNCNCLQIDVIPGDISKYYPSTEYYSYNNSKQNRKNNIIGYFRNKITNANVKPAVWSDFLLRKILPNKRLNFLNGVVTSKNTKILDYGSGDSMKFLYPLYEAGFHNILGMDPFLSNKIVHDNNLKIVNKSIHELNGDWDVICLNHSFEHVFDPHKALSEIYDKLKDDGVCIIRIPIAAYAWGKYGVNWFQIDAPRHAFLHTKESMNLLAEQTGFTIDKIEFDSTHHQFTLSERYKKGRSLNEKSYDNSMERIIHVIRKVNYSIKAKKLNKSGEGDQVILHLRKA